MANKEIFLVPNKVELKTIEIQEVIDRIKNESKNFVIPEYQRDYVWNTNSIDKLLLSLYKGYPIGSMLIQNTKTDKTKLLDGLQRTFSLIKIGEKPLNFITEELVFYHFKKKTNEDLSDDYIESIARIVYKKIQEYSAESGNVSPQQIYGNSTSDSVKRELIKNFISDFEDWIEYDFPKIIIPHIALTAEYDDEEASEVFGLINDEGKGLNKYEILSSYWSNFPINASKNKFIEKFIVTRIERFLETINSEETEVSEETIDMDTKNVSPANFIYAVFDECINRNISLKNIFYKGQRLRTNAHEPIMSIFANYLNIDSLAPKSLKTIGPKLQERMNSKDEIEKITEMICEAMKVVANSISLFDFISSNGNNAELYDKFGLSMSMIAAFINTVLKEFKAGKEVSQSVQGKYFEDWALIETIEGEYDSGSNNRAWKNFKEKKYLKKPNKKVSEVVIEHIEKEHKLDTVKKTPSTSTLLILSLLQHKTHKIDSLELDIDHIIPKSLLSPQKLSGHNYINTIANLQLLDSEINRKIKSDKIIPIKDQYDFLLSKSTFIRIPEIFKKNHRMYLEIMKQDYYNLSNDGMIKEKLSRRAGKKIYLADIKKKIDLSDFMKFYELRYEFIKEIIKEQFNGKD